MDVNSIATREFPKYDPGSLPGPLELHQYAWISGTFFGALAIFLSCWLIYKHLRYFSDPIVQVYIVRIILLIPIYTANSILSMYFKDISLYLIVGRDCYESYVLYMFFRLLCELAGGEVELIYQLEEVPQIRYSLPFCMFHIKPGKIFLHRCRQMILQFVIVKPILALITLGLEIVDEYREGDFSPRYGYLWISIFYNVSITISLYFLVLFYEGTKTILAPYKPISKFLCIKTVIFFAFWQAVVISGMAHIKFLIEDTEDWDVADISNVTNNWLICIEMFPTAVAYAYTFGYKSFKDPSFNVGPREDVAASLSIWKNFLAVMNVMDVLRDAKTASSKAPKKELKELAHFMTLPKNQQQAQIIHAGYLEKKGEDIAKLYKRRFFVVLREPPGIAVFREDPYSIENKSRRMKPRGFINFNVVSGVEPKRDKSWNIITPNRVWRLRCKTGDERPQWMTLVMARCKLKGAPEAKYDDSEQVGLDEDY